MSGYEFEIRECGNGWLWQRQYASDEEYYPTLNDLCEAMLKYVHSDFPTHRNTKQRDENSQPGKEEL